MGHPSYIVLQKNGRYAEVVSFYNSRKKRVVVSIDFADIGKNYKYQQYMNGYYAGYYNIIVTEYEPDNLKSYLNGCQIIYDKAKMNGKYQVGSGRVVTFTHDTPFKANVAQENPTVNKKFSDRDSAGNDLSREQLEYFKDSKVRDEKDRLMVMYHGTPNGNHTTFRSGTYFTPDRQYADVYQSPGASMLSTKRNADNPKTYEAYLNIKKPFDTRKPKERRIFMQEYYRQWGTGAPLADSGLPDWTDGMDLQEFIEEMGYDYDGLILDEGATGGYGQEVKRRGLSYVVFSSEQVKNLDNKKPTSDPDIRYSERDGEVSPNATYAEIEEQRSLLICS